MDYLGILAQALIDEQKAKIAKQRAAYGSNWHPLIVIKNNESGKLYQEFMNIVKQFQDNLLAYNFQSKVDFSDLGELLDSKIEVCHIDDYNTGSDAIDSYSRWDNKTKQLIITYCSYLPENEEHFEIAYQLAHLILDYDWDITNDTLLTRKMLNHLKHDSFFNMNSHVKTPACTSDSFARDELALTYAILLIVPQSELYKVIKRYPEDRIDHVADQFSISRRLARFRLQIEQQLPNSILNR